MGVFNYFIEVFTDHVRIAPEDEGLTEDASPGSWEPKYELSWIPDNYELFGTESTVSRLKEIYMHTYISSSGFNFWQQDSSSFSISVDNETTTHEITEINGYEAHLFYELYPDVSDELESMCYNVLLIWQEGNTTLHISALDMSRADIFRIAEGIRPIRK